MVTTLINELLAADAADAISLIQRLIADPVLHSKLQASAKALTIHSSTLVHNTSISAFVSG